ncbi:gluconokinase [Phytomonospora endophytica]|uniref:Gluconokinase n=1 Tax=Phytomonospora endophytica TaxID=714109 RepID=A0A841FHA0_9ACTN|nr:gluconokinase [Phytomonospora endophytica]MBB6036701.1 gluconokinase [Phytomonospora endophytica]GIG66023.1 gluconokinase [Phytomonospora endophytica]
MVEHLVVMGVSGSGKTTVGRLLAGHLDRVFADADDFHTATNVAKMHAGQALTDADRSPWLQAVAAWIGEYDAEGTPTVVACSALKRSYRDVLRTAPGRIRFVHLAPSPADIAARMRARTGHFMPPELLASQLADLQPLTADEDGVTVETADGPEETVRMVLGALGEG